MIMGDILLLKKNEQAFKQSSSSQESIRGLEANLFDFSRRECRSDALADALPFLVAGKRDHFTSILTGHWECLLSVAWSSLALGNNGTETKIRLTRRLIKCSESLTKTKRTSSASEVTRFGLVPSNDP